MKRTPGRPPLDKDDPSVPLSFSLPSKKFDALSALARRYDMTIPEIVRRLIYGHMPEKTTKK